jgi:hypothetical protein
MFEMKVTVMAVVMVTAMAMATDRPLEVLIIEMLLRVWFTQVSNGV